MRASTCLNRSLLTTLGLGCALLAGAAGCGGSRSAGGQTVATESDAAAQVDPPRKYPLPDGGNDVLFAHIQALEDQELRGDNEEARLRDYQEQLASQFAAAEKILATHPEGEELDRAHKAKLAAYSRLVRIGRIDLYPGLSDYAKSITEKTPESYAVAREVLDLLPVHVARIKLRDLLGGLMQGDASRADPLVAELEALASKEGPTPATFSILQQVGQVLETTGQTAAGLKVFNLMASIFEKAPRSEVTQAALDTAANAKKRLGFIGQTLDLEGEVFGEDRVLHLSELRGKVVLVDFWATWCGPCVMEFPHMKRNYDRYHDQGFEIVGLSMDEDEAALSQFLANKSVPWPILFNSDPTERGTDGNPVARRVGVEFLPTTMLVDRDGRVLRLHIRGDELDRELHKLFPSAPSR